MKQAGAVAVLGIGNLVHEDDGVGIHAINLFSANREFRPESFWWTVVRKV